MNAQAPFQIDYAKNLFQAGTERFLQTFEFVPDEKLTWAPSSTGKTALRLAAHVGISNYGFAALLEGKKSEFGSPEELFEFFDLEESKITSRPQAVKNIKDSTKVLLNTFAMLKPEKLSSTLATPFGDRPMAQMIMVPGIHMYSHASQLDYLQTLWGDLDPHM